MIPAFDIVNVTALYSEIIHYKPILAFLAVCSLFIYSFLSNIAITMYLYQLSFKW